MIERIEPQPGQESVWDYPRPPKVEDVGKHLVVKFNGVVIAETRRAKRVLETSHPPNYYFPPQDVKADFLVARFGTTTCEWKGEASYFSIFTAEDQIPVGAWYYPAPTPKFSEIQGYVAFYPQYLDCFVDDEKARAQSGDFYGGWITVDVVGPFKGEPGTENW